MIKSIKNKLKIIQKNLIKDSLTDRRPSDPNYKYKIEVQPKKISVK